LKLQNFFGGDNFGIFYEEIFGSPKFLIEKIDQACPFFIKNFGREIFLAEFLSFFKLILYKIIISIRIVFPGVTGKL
jgi:hypothetical protein